MIVLDTHAWIWWQAEPEKLSAVAARTIDEAIDGGLVLISAFSCWELAMLVDKGRLVLAMDVDTWLARSRALPFLEIVPVDASLALLSVQLPGTFHPDPADRLIVATALQRSLPLVTKDQRLRAYPHVETVW